MPNLYMLIGLPGSGKSTFAKHLSGVRCSTDDVIEKVAELENKTYNQVFIDWIKQAEKIMYANLQEAIEYKHNIIWDQTNLTKKGRKGKLDKIPNNYKKIAFVFYTGSWTLEKVNEERKKIGRAIPDNILLDMQKNFEYPTKDEGFDEIYFIKNREKG